MEFAERKRRRKSQSFKLVTDEGVWMGKNSMEIKKQTTGMMGLLGDRTGRVYQRLVTEQNSSTKEPQGGEPNYTPSAPGMSLVSEDPQSWSSPEHPEPPRSSASATSIHNGQACGQYSTRSRGLKAANTTKHLINPSETKADELHPAVAEIPCCMCNCRGTLQAILHELRAMRRLMQSQKGTFERRERVKSSRQPHVKSLLKAAPLSVCGTRRASLSSPSGSALKTESVQAAKIEECKELHCSTISCDVSALPAQNDQVADSGTCFPLLSQLGEHQALESEVRLAADYDVFISKAQLDSILVNYTRSGSLLFRKLCNSKANAASDYSASSLVCAFFDDPTLANSLPNGKRKRGLNDNRKGLDQNIVGAIKVFTEKYCTEHRIEKLPGPRDWVQILQDQIKLARRRLKRDAADAEETSNGPSTSINFA